MELNLKRIKKKKKFCAHEKRNKNKETSQKCMLCFVLLAKTTKT